MSTERSAVLGSNANNGESLLSVAAHKAAGALGAELADACPIAEPFLEHSKGPEDIKKIPMALLPNLAAEVRQTIHNAVSQTGGHLASNLGVVELTIALHRVFDFKHDRLVFDVGHQIYTHKILTGRAKNFGTLRQLHGISGYPHHRENPEYDLFHTAHAGCAVSSALGLQLADQKLDPSRQSVAVVGDGALTSGVVFEALNHAGDLKANMLVILNDNGCSISTTTGALSATCSDLRRTQIYKQVKEKGKEWLEKIPYVGKEVEKFAEGVADATNRATHGKAGSLFVDFGFKYYGPIDGHDHETLHSWLKEMKNTPGPKLLHVVTQKGKGLAWSESDPITWHGAKPYEVKGDTAIIKKSTKPTPAAYTKVVSDAIIEVARENSKVVAITAAMPDGTGLVNFQKAFPDRYYDVGICEQHAVCMGAAMAKGGLRPVAAIYSSFLQRAIDQLMHDVSLQDGLPLVLCLDRAGVVGDDGPTHNGVFDLAYMRSFPYFTLIAPKDGQEAVEMVKWAVKQHVPVAIRYPRDNVPETPLTAEFKPLLMGKGEIIRKGEKVAILGYGATVVEAVAAAEKLEKEKGMKITVANARFCKPMDGELVKQLFENHDRVITAEDHQLMNGFGTAVLEECNAQGLDTRKLVRLGIPDRYVDHGPRKWQLQNIGIDADSMIKAVLK